MAGAKKEPRRQSERVVPSIDQGTSRVSRAAGRVSTHSGQHASVEQRSNVPSSRTPSSRQGRRSAAAPSRQRGSSGKAAQSPRRGSASRAGSTPPDSTKDAQFIKWAGEKWSSLEPHQQQGVFSMLLLLLSLLLFGSLTIFTNVPVLSGINKFFLTFFGWSAYPLAFGLVAFALAHLIEGMRKQRFIRWSLVVGLVVIWLLLLVESRLFVDKVGVLAEVLVKPLLGWPSAVAHVIVIGLLLITAIITFRITFGHVLMVAGFLRNMIADPERSAAPSPDAGQRTRRPAASNAGQRPQYSRYGNWSSSAGPAAQASRGGRRLADEEIEGDDDGAIEFEADFEEDNDPRNDINLHKREVGTVPREPRTPPRALDLTEHREATRGANQRQLPFNNDEEDVQPSPDLEPLAPNPRMTSRQKPPRTPQPPPQLIVSPWKLPDTSMLHSPAEIKMQMLGDDTGALARTIQETLRSFRVEAEVRPEDISIGPTVIRFGIRPTGKPEMKIDEKTGKAVPVRDGGGNIIYETRTRVSRIMALQNDLALVLEAKAIRMEAPVPGRPYVGVEIPNKNSRLVTLREVLESKEYQVAKGKSKLAVALGRDVAGQVRIGDLARMPHLLIAGATGAGKCLAYDEPVFLADGQVVKVQQLIGQVIDVIGVTDTHTMQQVPVPATFTENGVREVFEIVLDNGLVLQRTGEHPLWAACLDENQHVGRQKDGKAMRRTRAIGAGWVRAEELRVCGNRPNFEGHVILCPRSLQQQGTVQRKDADVILCAALLAEGGLNSTGRANLLKRSLGTPRFTNADAPMVNLVDVAAREYGCQLVLSPHKTKGNIDYYISQIVSGGQSSRNPVAQLVCDWKINCLATQKRIPEWVFQLPDDQIALFLRVFIDCDGWISVRGHRSTVNVSLANAVLVQQIAQLALRLGITGTFTHKENGFAGAWTWSTYMVQAWQERVGSLLKAEKLSLAVEEQQKSRECGATIWNAWRRAQPLPGQKFANCPEGYEWRKVVAIRRVTAPTVNIEVHSENHAYVGYAVEHNSVMINALICSILGQGTPDDVRLLMVDPKMVELNLYNGIPHLLAPVVIEVDKVVSLLKNAISEMERRYRLFSQLGVRNLDGYRRLRLEKLAKGDTSLNNLPAIVIIIDELADLMMAAPEEVEGMICRLAQLARATGIHLVIATQRPSVDVITGLIKANIPTRISFMVSSAVDSRTIIDMGGAERLLGRGDMLYLPADAGRPERIQGAFVADDETEALVDYWRQQLIDHNAATIKDNGSDSEAGLRVESGWELREEPSGDFELDDDLLDKAEEIVREYGRASISLLQRRLRIGYSRAARLIDLLEEHGIIGQPETGGRAREVLNNGYEDEGQSLSAEAEDIIAEERARNEFLRQQQQRQNDE